MPIFSKKLFCIFTCTNFSWKFLQVVNFLTSSKRPQECTCAVYVAVSEQPVGRAGEGALLKPPPFLRQSLTSLTLHGLLAREHLGPACLSTSTVMPSPLPVPRFLYGFWGLTQPHARTALIPTVPKASFAILASHCHSYLFLFFMVPGIELGHNTC